MIKYEDTGALARRLLSLNTLNCSCVNSPKPLSAITVRRDHVLACPWCQSVLKIVFGKEEKVEA